MPIHANINMKVEVDSTDRKGHILEDTINASFMPL